MSTHTDILTPLGRLHVQAELRGWKPDTGRNARPYCWVAPDEQSHFVVLPPGEVAMVVVSAHLPDDSLRVQIGNPHRADRALRILREFLGWADDGEATQ